MTLFELFGVSGGVLGLCAGGIVGAKYGVVGCVVGAVVGVPVGIVGGIGFTLVAIVTAHIKCTPLGEVKPSTSVGEKSTGKEEAGG